MAAHPILHATSRRPLAAAPAAVRLRPTTAATAPTLRLPTTTGRLATTILLPIAVTLRRTATIRLRTETIRRLVPSLPVRPTRPRVALPRRVVIPDPRLAPPEAAVAAHIAAAVEADSMAAVVVADPIPVAAEARTAAVAITNSIAF
jgi:hypothetical protein